MDFKELSQAARGRIKIVELQCAADLQKKLDAEGFQWHVVNQGISGDTTAEGVARIDSATSLKPGIVILELGGNDGLRGLPPGVTEANLQSIIDKVRARSPLTRIMIAGMRLPPNLGADYTGEFEQVFSVAISTKEIQQIRTFGDIIRQLSAKVGSPV